MLNVDAVRNVNFISKPMFKAKNKVEQAENNADVSLQGMVALASYNTTLLRNPKVLDFPPLPLIHNPNEKFEGEEVYKSNGELYSITKDNGNTKLVFKPAEYEDELGSITVLDKKTGKLLALQENYKNSDNTITNHIYKYSPINGKFLQSCVYKDGKLTYNTKKIASHGIDEAITDDLENKSYTISKSGKNFHQAIEFNKDKTLANIWQEKTRGLKTSSTEVKFYNGAILSIEKNEKVTVPNNLSIENLKDINLTPAPKFVTDKDYKGLEGEKTYYSNGMLETNNINNGEVIAHFSPDGILTELDFADKTIKYDSDNVQEIEEKIDDKMTKITRRCKDNGVSVTLEQEGSTKELHLSAENRPVAYWEREKDTDGNYIKDDAFYFNEQGMLEAAYQY